MKLKKLSKTVAALLLAFSLSHCGGGSDNGHTPDAGWNLMFASNLIYKTGASPVAVVVEDFNQDGRPDMAAANFESDTISVFLSSGDHSFANRFSCSVGHAPAFLKTADLNQDGFPDLITAYSGSPELSLLYNNQDGTFSEPADHTIEQDTGIVSLALADFNGDTYPDMVVVQQFPHKIRILMNRGDGTFSPGESYSSEYICNFAAVADFNQDGHNDIAVARQGSGMPDCDLLLLKNNGRGEFTEEIHSGIDFYYTSIFPGDLDNDNDIDLILSGSIYVDGAYMVLNKGDGTFDFSEKHLVEDVCSPVALGDLDGDGYLDLIAKNIFNHVAVVFNRGDGTFGDPAAYFSATDPVDVAIGDLDSDMDLDLAVANNSCNSITLHLNKGDGHFFSIEDKALSISADRLCVDDLDGDADLDLVTLKILLSGGIPPVADHIVETALNSGNGVFNRSTRLQNAQHTVFIATADIDRDGYMDIAACRQDTNSLSINYNEGNGTFAAYDLLPVGDSPVCVAIADLDGNDLPDLAAVNSQSNTVCVLYNNGNRIYTPAEHYGTGNNPMAVAIGDLDNDGYRDLVVGNYGSYSVSVFFNNRDRTFSVDPQIDAGCQVNHVAVGDLNGDGFADIIISSWFYDRVSVFLNRTNRSFGEPVAVDYGALERPGPVIVDDFDRDGDFDIAVSNWLLEGVSIHLNNGDGVFQMPEIYFSGVGTKDIRIGDINGDKCSEMLIARGGYQKIVVLNSNAQQ